jgi:hypothetical protein
MVNDGVRDDHHEGQTDDDASENGDNHQHDVTSKTRAANRRLLPIDTGMSALYPTRKAKISAESVGAGPHGLP